MKKDEVFTFTAPNGVKVVGVVVAILSESEHQTIAMGYAQNRLFTVYEHIARDTETGEECYERSYGENLVDYAILPEYDTILENLNLDDSTQVF